jgi:hypothetical protein
MSPEVIDAAIRCHQRQLTDLEAKRSRHAERGEMWEAMCAASDKARAADTLTQLLARRREIAPSDDKDRALGASNSFFVSSNR